MMGAHWEPWEVVITLIVLVLGMGAVVLQMSMLTLEEIKEMWWIGVVAAFALLFMGAIFVLIVMGRMN